MEAKPLWHVFVTADMPTLCSSISKFMAEKMQLTPEERTKVEAINQKYADQMQPVLVGQMGPFARMREVKKLQEAKDGELKAVLTPAQYQTYEASKAEMKQRLEQRALK